MKNIRKIAFVLMIIIILFEIVIIVFPKIGSWYNNIKEEKIENEKAESIEPTVNESGGQNSKKQTSDWKVALAGNAIANYTGEVYDGMELVIPSKVDNNNITYLKGIGDSIKNIVFTVEISNGITSIGKEVFKDCIYLHGKLVIPNTVTSIGDEAFYGCSELTGEIILPSSVEFIGKKAFAECIGITKIKYSKDTKVKEDTFLNIPNVSAY